MKNCIVNPLALANAKLAEAREAAKAHVAQIKYTRSQMERTGFTYLPTASVAEVAAAGAEWERKRTALRSAEMNFNEAVFVMDLLDAAPESKASLEAAYTFLETRHAAYVKATKQSLLSKVADMFKPSQNAQDEQPEREPIRGPVGVAEPKPLEIVLADIAQHVTLYPEGKSYSAILSAMNTVNGRLQLPEQRPAQARRMDEGLVVVER